MKPPDHAKAHIAAAAALGALTEARRESDELLSGPSQDGAPALLRRHAAEMARSPLGRDQLLSLALLAAADDLEGGRSPAAASKLVLPEPGPDENARVEVRARVLRSPFLPSAEARRAAEDLERRHRPESANDLDLSARLTAEAHLHERLWDDPRLPADDRTRLVMLFSAPHLLDLAEGLGPNRRPQVLAHRVDRRPPWRLRKPLGVPLSGWMLVLVPAVVAATAVGLAEG